MDLDRLDASALDRLPHGAIALDRDGRIVHYNEVEARRARLRRWQVIGRDFFRELAWTLGADAIGRIRAFHAGCALVPAGFTARVVAHGVEREVAIRLARGDGGLTWIVTEAAPTGDTRLARGRSSA